tara:strand:- start:14 stop:1186 length:1173 start_codon:yes stop_codon:yes gene_type:complete
VKILFIITASIAIKKCNEIFKDLNSKKILIDCIVTENAKKITNVDELKKNISGEIYDNKFKKKHAMLHIELTRSSDLIVVCPATANIIGKFANGHADDLASTSLLASNKQIIIIPAMNVEMWENQSNKKNVDVLKNMGVEFIGPEYGKLSCGEIGLGRLSEPKKINKILLQNLKLTKFLKNKKCLVTAGPTIEPIDSVRYLSNYSSGKQGYAIAKQMILSGADVTLISGPTNLQAPYKSKLIKINTANEMLNVVKANSKVDIAIFAAAVCDVSPVKTKKTKIKKNNLKSLNFKLNKDIISEISSLKNKRPKIIIGFAAETNDHIANAKKKLIQKNCDVIVVNKIDKNNLVFGSENNKVSIITRKKTLNFEKSSKTIVAKRIVRIISEFIS